MTWRVVSERGGGVSEEVRRGKGKREVCNDFTLLGDQWTVFMGFMHERMCMYVQRETYVSMFSMFDWLHSTKPFCSRLAWVE